MNTLLRHAYAPSLFFLGIALATWLLGDQHVSPLWLIGLLLVAWLISHWVERRIPFRARWNLDHKDTRRDRCHALTIEGGNVLFLAALGALGGHLTVLPPWPQHRLLWSLKGMQAA